MIPTPLRAPRCVLRRALSIFRVLVALVLLVVIAGGTAFLILGNTRHGGDAVDWAARQVVGIVERSIVPEVGFERFEYEAPRTLRFLDLTLTSPGGVRVVEARSVEVELTAIPRYGEPVLIERIGVVGGLVDLIETREADGGMGFEGLAPFVKPRESGARSTASASEPAPGQHYEGERLLSDVLQIRLVTLDDCGVRYSPLSGDPPMRLMGVTTELTLTDEEEGGRHWHRFALELARGSALEARFAGRFDLDRLEIDLAPSTLRLDLTGGPVEELPPGIQTLLSEFDVTGVLRVTAEGAVPVRDMNSATARASLELKKANLAFGEYRLPITSALFDASLRGGVATIERGDVNAMGGQALVRGAIELREDTRPAALTWSLGGMRLREILRGGTPEGETPRLAGIVESRGEATMDALAGVESLRGEGVVDVTKGKFGQIDMLSRLLRFIGDGKKVDETALTSELHGEFAIRGPALDFSSLSVTTPVVSARGQGVLHFDGRLDFLINGGPLERVQELLGDFGRIFGVVTDQFVKYRVRGTVSAPEIAVAPLGVGAAIDRSELP